MNITPGKEHRLVVGGESRIQLLPPEVAARAKTRSTRRALVGVVVLACLISAGGYTLSTIAATRSAADLALEQNTTTVLLRQQSQYAEVTQVETLVATATAARQVGTSTEILWTDYLAQIMAVLPSGTSINGMSVESATPLQYFGQSTAPLQGERVATIALEVVAPSLADVQSALTGMSGLPGFVDASPAALGLDDAGRVGANIVLHIDSRAYAGRFAPASATTTDGESQ